MSTYKQAGSNSAYAVSAVVTSVIAGWFLVAAGAVAAGTAPERFSATPPASQSVTAAEQSLRPDTRLAITVVAKRHA